MSKPPRSPPRFVPTLTEVVPDAKPALAQESLAQATAPAPSTVGPIQIQACDGLEELLVHRVMQRVDMGLDRRLRDAIATVVQEQTRSVLPRLREEVESVVRQVVYEAVADELASKNQAPAFKRN